MNDVVTSVMALEEGVRKMYGYRRSMWVLCLLTGLFVGPVFVWLVEYAATRSINTAIVVVSAFLLLCGGQAAYNAFGEFRQWRFHHQKVLDDIRSEVERAVAEVEQVDVMNDQAFVRAATRAVALMRFLERHKSLAKELSCPLPN